MLQGQTFELFLLGWNFHCYASSIRFSFHNCLSRSSKSNSFVFLFLFSTVVRFCKMSDVAEIFHRKKRCEASSVRQRPSTLLKIYKHLMDLIGLKAAHSSFFLSLSFFNKCFLLVIVYFCQMRKSSRDFPQEKTILGCFFLNLK